MCEDKLVIGTDLQQRMKGLQIDNTFNKRVFIVETNNTLLVITFNLCYSTFKGSKFRAVVNAEGGSVYVINYSSAC